MPSTLAAEYESIMPSTLAAEYESIMPSTLQLAAKCELTMPSFPTA